VRSLALIGLGLVLGACSGLKVDGACTFVRSVTVTYQCPAEGKLEHYRIWPPEP
jgi:hypothetical protein